MLSNDDAIHFRPCTIDDIPLFVTWIKKPHVNTFWTLESHQDDPEAYITEKIHGNGYDHPFFIMLGAVPIGYIQYWEYDHCPDPGAVFPDEPPGTIGIDIFIGEKDALGKGYGTQVMDQFIAFLFTKPEITKLVIDPDEKNKPAIRCYEKSGFTFARNSYDKDSTFHVMEMFRK